MVFGFVKTGSKNMSVKCTMVTSEVIPGIRRDHQRFVGDTVSFTS